MLWCGKYERVDVRARRTGVPVDLISSLISCHAADIRPRKRDTRPKSYILTAPTARAHADFDCEDANMFMSSPGCIFRFRRKCGFSIAVRELVRAHLAATVARVRHMTQPILPPAALWSAAAQHDEQAEAVHDEMVDTMLDEGGTSFDEHFELRNKLGDGMTACVYVARDRRTGKYYACKLCERRGHRSTWSRLSEIIRHEHALLEQVGPHPNLVSHHGFFEGSSRCAVLLGLVQGGDCQQLLQRHGALPEESVQGMVTQLHCALSHLHSLRVLHRDIKLENILCDMRARPPAVKLCDLGHASTFDSLHSERVFFGTPGYAARECLSRLHPAMPHTCDRLAVHCQVAASIVAARLAHCSAAAC